MSTLRILLMSFASLCGAHLAFAQSEAGPSVASDAIATDPAYRFTPGDSIAITVHGQADLSTVQRIDDSGFVRFPLLEDVKLAGMSVREAEKHLEETYRKQELLRAPLVNLRVTAYATREASVLGAVGNPGPFRFPQEYTEIEIVDLVSRVGGLKPTAKGDAVQVTRPRSGGGDDIMIVDVESMINRRRGRDVPSKSFLIQPGDRIWVPERLF